jgi:hypothetical protein
MLSLGFRATREQHVADGFWFYEGQAAGLGDYFRSSITADIESLACHGCIHERVAGYHRSLSRRFPFTIYYRIDDGTVTVVAVLEARRSPSWIRDRLSP